MITTIFMGHACEWDDREEAIRFFRSLLLYRDDASPEAMDRVETVITNLERGAKVAVDFETAE